jgi:hypothetical protein
VNGGKTRLRVKPRRGLLREEATVAESSSELQTPKCGLGFPISVL